MRSRHEKHTVWVMLASSAAVLVGAWWVMGPSLSLTGSGADTLALNRIVTGPTDESSLNAHGRSAPLADPQVAPAHARATVAPLASLGAQAESQAGLGDDPMAVASSGTASRSQIAPLALPPTQQTPPAASQAGPSSLSSGPSDSRIASLSSPEPSETDPTSAGPLRFNGRPLRRVAVVPMEVTAYSPDERSCGPYADGITASGKSVWTNGMKLVAADTRLLPFGSLVSIPDYHGGRPVPVLDRGGAIKGHKLDVLMPSHEQAMQWGRQRKAVTIWVYADQAIPSLPPLVASRALRPDHPPSAIAAAAPLIKPIASPPDHSAAPLPDSIAYPADHSPASDGPTLGGSVHDSARSRLRPDERSRLHEIAQLP